MGRRNSSLRRYVASLRSFRGSSSGVLDSLGGHSEMLLGMSGRALLASKELTRRNASTWLGPELPLLPTWRFIPNMNVPLDSEFVGIARGIAAEARSEAEWAEMESDDMFQTDHYCGGYEAEEMAFCFSYYAPDGSEYWFQLDLRDIERVVAGELNTVSGRPAG